MSSDWMNGINDNHVNPEPIVFEETELMVNDFLSPNKLQELSGEDDLTNVQTLEMTIDTSETTLGNFGQYLPNLLELRLSDSIIPTVRDVGTSFGCLKILWMSRCGLNDIDGITSMQCLQELYIAYNNIEDVSPVSFLDSLEVLDVEGNKIADVEQIDYLSIMTSLTTLTLSGNPVCHNFRKQIERSCSYREFILGKVPQLMQLDDESSSSTAVESVRPATSMSSHSQEDMDMITSAIKEGLIIESDATPKIDLNFTDSSNSVSEETDDLFSSELPSSFSMNPLRRFNVPRPATAAPTGRSSSLLPEKNPTVQKSRPDSSGSESGKIHDDSSVLTFGDPICGNPIQALRNRRKTPLPVMSLLNHGIDDIRSKPRPSTAGGTRRPIKAERSNFNFEKVAGSDSFNSLKFNSNESLNQNTPDISQRCKFDGPKSPSPSYQQASSTNSSFFKTPTPPRSPQRPQSALDFRTSRFRRSFPSPPSHSVNIMTVENISSRLSQDQIRTQIEDRST
ncbi:leucine-rich repeat-containing protein 56-like [Clavelina lepadiformis]|uniref:leucine-rich repeat-containing protein 56-like n=1 Tax=Clavelina lepadiformis TaxID=159417 RepID=UPI0040436096